MATKQKSFFDQDDRARARPQWQRVRDEQRRREHDADLHRRSFAKSPIKPSELSRKKLKAFELNDARLADPSEDLIIDPRDNDENVPISLAAHASVVQPMKPLAVAPTPSTPAMRLPLADLIGNTDDVARRQHLKEQSPEEQLGWIPNSSNSALTPGRRRKRARSSSPVSSSQNNDPHAHFAYKEPFDLPGAPQFSKTPHADPATELWNRYAIGIEKTLPPDFARLANESSPHALPRTPDHSVGGLRRWASCGAEWPPSRIKNRRPNGVFRDRHHASAANPISRRQDTTRPLPSSSRVGMLVNQIQATLAQPVVKVAMPSALPKACPPPDTSGQEPEDHSKHATTHQLEPMSSHVPLQSASSDYGDDVDDSDMIDDAEADLICESLLVKAEHELRPIDSASQTGLAHKSSCPPLPIIVEQDDFDDDDMLTAEDIENAIPLLASNPIKVHQTHLTETHPEVGLAKDQKVQQPRPPAPQPSQSSDDDDFGGSDIDDEHFAVAERSLAQVYQQSLTATQASRSRAIQRYLVKEILQGIYDDKDGRTVDEKILHVEDEAVKSHRTISLRQSWLDTHVSVGAYVHIVGLFSALGSITIDDADNLLIVHPDHLVSATAVADSFDCLRKAVLQDRVKATSLTSKPTVYGSMIHEIFQSAMQRNKWDHGWLDTLVQTTVRKYIEPLFEAGAKDTNEALEHVRSKMPELQAWASNFVRQEPGSNSLAEDRNGKKIPMSISKLLDVEEHVWSPMYGLKGNIDASVEVVMDDDQGRRTLTVPFEVKTGKHKSAAHRAQTALYTLLLSDRYDLDIVYGILFYTEGSSVIRIPAVRNELRHMVMQRNELASFVRERLELPPMLKNEFKCGRCYAKTSCFLYHKLSEDGTTATAGVGEKFHEIVSKLKPAHQTFFKQWDDLLTKEESEMFKLKRELWTMLSHERAKVGRAFSEVIIDPNSRYEQNDGQKINRYTYDLVKKDSPPAFSFTESQIAVGEPIVISSEAGHFALANGYCTKVSRSRITVAVDRRLHNSRIRQPGFDVHNNQSFRGLMEVGKENDSHSLDSEPGDETVVYRLDKDEFSNGMATVRNNLLAVMDDEVYRAEELRRLVVDNAPPIFTETPTAYTLAGTSSQLANINSDQRAAIDKVMSARDYALVLGMPGTGKTTTIAHIIRALVARGKSVLLTSYTHTAVDNILLKFRGLDMSVLRLGVRAKIHPDVQDFAELAAEPRSSIEELEKMYMAPQVVATTCLGINHQIFQRRIFDYCIVDEASQITLPVCLGPIRMARTFILVGDHYQLPPLVQNKAAQKGGLDVSLFKLLSDRQAGSVVSLEHQYRMCADVMALSNALIYNGRLKCGNEAVANRKLELPTIDGLIPVHRSSGASAHSSCTGRAGECWLLNLLSPDRRVVFADCDAVGHKRPHEKVVGSRITNNTEAGLVVQTVLSLLAMGVPSTEIGVITFYRSQLGLLRHEFKGTAGETVEMHTADKFQGRDKEGIVLSCVRSNETSNVGDLLRDWRRVNVALTRSRSKLVVLGSRITLGSDELLSKFLELVDTKGWTIKLPQDALNAHDFESFLGSARGIIATQRAQARGGHSTSRTGTGTDESMQPFVQDDFAGSENRSPGDRARRQAGKKGLVTQRAVLQSKPVLNDIVNDMGV